MKLKKTIVAVISVILVIFATGVFGQKTTVRGIVFDDKNKDGIKNADEKPVAKIAVSNGTQVELTDKNGRYELPIEGNDVIFVIKPSGWQTRTDSLNIPRFYYLSSQAQTSKDLNFPLYKAKESQKFDAVYFGDPQLISKEQVGYLYHDAIEEIAGLNAQFGVILGDIVFEKQELYGDIDNAIALSGIKFYRIAGNHDMDFDAGSDDGALETIKKRYGPAYYSFNYGDVHFIALDNIIGKRTDDSRLRYNEGLTDRQLEFVKNDLACVGKDKLIVVMGHANFTEFSKNKKEILDVLAQYPHTLSIAGHDHIVENIFLDSKDGWQGKEPHHIFIAGAVCGGWWMGLPGEENIPNAMMYDGSPNGYAIVSFEKNKYSIRYKGFGKDKDYQMIAFLPDEMAAARAGQSEVILNIFAGSKKDSVKMSIDSQNQWQSMECKPDKPPYFLAALEQEKKYNFKRYEWMTNDISPTNHIWKAKLPENLKQGAHIIYFHWTVMYGNQYTAKRIFRVVAD